MSPKFLGAALIMVLAAGYVAWHRSTATPDSASPPTAALVPAKQGDLEPVLARIEHSLKELEKRLRRLETADPPSVTLASTDPDLEDLSQRLAAVEAQLRRMPDAGVLDELAFPLESQTLSPEEQDGKRLDSLREAFETDNNAGPALRAELENAAPLFDAEEVAGLEFNRVDCRTNYCRLEYEDNSSNGADAMIAENELFLLLSEKYGQDIVIHGGERNGRSRSIYIELSPD